MDRSTMTVLARALGGSVYYSDVKLIQYQFQTEAKLFEFREQIPFLNAWVGGDMRPPAQMLSVFLDKLK